MAFSSMVHIIFILSLVSHSSSLDVASPPGKENTVWVMVATAAMVGALVALLLLGLVGLMWRVAEVRSGVGPLLLLLAGIVGLCSLSITYLIERGEHLCVVRRSFWGVLFALSFACLVVHGVRLRQLVRGARSPGNGVLVGLAVFLAIVDPEWILLIVVRRDLSACEYHPLELVLTSSYVLLLLATALVGAVWSLCGGQPQWRCSAMWLLATCLSSALLWTTWLTFHLHGNAALGLSSAWDDWGQALLLVAQAWVLLVLHAVPKVHATLRATRHQRDGFPFDDSSSASESDQNGTIRTEPIAPCQGNIDHTTVQIFIVDEAAVSSMPPTFTGPHDAQPLPLGPPQDLELGQLP
ncbi:G-protein coupled receptor family C group 5 member B-like [Brienomyrus brachyistius]|uniref:G-protein coupled receptor family C group 5 member B-like n=1 Tax=Brienomyrus brachyistius TaxID=42636 RepID=UPI0020B31C53|nr:G-protein coupled receptor family C group 5 member B-like [Brienomyrus brachyistius]XP_048874629.1 G-protein coupled receptor family C group 5 member B-like [Brienomyrus brachyistius]XP_048874631.1 G-protein coupled receptor family C group 5 member B-like [Brienomyrus brachyistius]XP_048874632.1 G-protein coupled receptor family C group 5 member B-like [Brienomyrus brachyistius]